MKKSEILHELQTEIARHDLSTFMNEKEQIVQTGCPGLQEGVWDSTAV
jgi:hypothetical protein